MKKIISLLSLGALVLAVGACHPKPRHPHAGGDFCPPGQAKKGNC